MEAHSCDVLLRAENAKNSVSLYLLFGESLALFCMECGGNDHLIAQSIPSVYFLRMSRGHAAGDRGIK